ncbi:hypothetical protein MRB53_020741 [Persea americana]|uniref:Uncharacterized protein n=1 Tax=Persea americana TaxID=3435 RepID=A0ACC2L321_PERAE|nr:hypothetical protein MRB53_020741 [Persea americana]
MQFRSCRGRRRRLGRPYTWMGVGWKTPLALSFLGTSSGKRISLKFFMEARRLRPRRECATACGWCRWISGEMADSGGRLPANSEGLGVGDSVGEIAVGHEGSAVGEVIDHLLLLLDELLGRADFGLGGFDEEAGLLFGKARQSESERGGSPPQRIGRIWREAPPRRWGRSFWTYMALHLATGVYST